MILLKRYKENRKIYNSKEKKYSTHSDFLTMIRNGVEFQVMCDETHTDITPSVLARLLADNVKSGKIKLPISFLRSVINGNIP
jgi:polyhydroxyalkanoate synthesis regulator protein